MDLDFIQKEIKDRGVKMRIKPQNSIEIMLGVAEEMGEVAKEVALFEKVGNKINWKRLPDKNLLSEEISHLLVNIISLASFYDISVAKIMKDLFEDKNK